MANTHRIAQPIELRNPYSNIDYNYGPYASKEAACTAIIKPQRLLGLTVAIEGDNGVEEYWFKEGVEDRDLVAKQEDKKIPPVDLSNYYDKDESDIRFSERGHLHDEANEGQSGFLPQWMYSEIMQLLGFNKEQILGRHNWLLNVSSIEAYGSHERRFDTFYVEYTQNPGNSVPLLVIAGFEVGENAYLIENKTQESIEFVLQENNQGTAFSTFKSLLLNPGKSVEVIAKFYGDKISVSHLFFEEGAGEVNN